MQQQKQRIITALIAIPIFLFLIYMGGWWLGALMIVLSGVGFWEYYKIVRRFAQETMVVWLLLGFAYIALGFLSFLGVRFLEGSLWLLLIIWTTDTAAYEIGRRFGKRPLAPTISPNKTREGFVAGLIGALIIGIVYGLWFMEVSLFGAIIISITISIFGQLGDLLESKFKRIAGVKDSGKILPGHGGVLDRFDSLLLASPIMYILLLIFI